MSAISAFYEFFRVCIGQWNSDRTYHYLNPDSVERSNTQFGVTPIDVKQKARVLTDNRYAKEPADFDGCPGLHFNYHTISETGEIVEQTMNLVFVPNATSRNRADQSTDSSFIEGDYLRDRAYEEQRPVIAHFRFDSFTREMLMTTRYAEIISIDSITLLTPKMRLRRIVNYPRPLEGQSLGEPELVGLGIEKKVSKEAKTDTDDMRKVFIPKIVDLYGIDYAAAIDKQMSRKNS